MLIQNTAATQTSWPKTTEKLWARAALRRFCVVVTGRTAGRAVITSFAERWQGRCTVKRLVRRGAKTAAGAEREAVSEFKTTTARVRLRTRAVIYEVLVRL